ncbi:hypothetical protein FIV42_29330 [Persicimonas caeni]|uniref:Lipoprotein n=1 Tax=Persicimonas caeni TaxID=2292766 RepID=A0A4Y6Q2K0_PERCE|nr:hypothetical protein [Persicimonas caeni]QDG54699.1 hypothetical protein FIV42_29330 [Persicimonas caeni]QED35920.1 hypothetical protein FRD00_29325 [Persicimonas caeni]
MKVRSVALAGVLAATAAAGCGDVDFGTPQPTEAVQREQSVTVVPEFSVSGTSNLPGNLYLSELGLAISEIRLEPLSSDLGSIAYSTRNPTRLHFDVANGETVKLGEPVDLPRAGRYLVSVRLEPIAEVQHSDEGAAETISPSFSVAGFVAGEGVVRVDPRYDEKRSDGSPVPMPFDEDEGDEDEMQDMPALPTEWTPFHYDSRRSVFFTLNEVEFEAGKQYLSFNFDVHDWALDLVDPLLSAVKHTSDIGGEKERGIDVTSPLESTGHGAEALFENAEVRAIAEGRRGL